VSSYQTQFAPIYAAKLSTQISTISGVAAAAVISLVACGLWMYFIGLSIQLPFDRLRLSRDGFVSETYGRSKARERVEMSKDRLSAGALAHSKEIGEHDEERRTREKALEAAKLEAADKMYEHPVPQLFLWR